MLTYCVCFIAVLTVPALAVQYRNYLRWDRERKNEPEGAKTVTVMAGGALAPRVAVGTATD